MALLQEAFEKALEYGLKDPSRREFGDFYPELDDTLVDALYDTYQQTLVLVRSHCQEEFKEVCKEQGVEEQLRQLEEAEAAQASTSGAVGTPFKLRDTAEGVSVEVVARAEAAARLHALKQEAAYLQDLLERARTTEARLTEALAMRQGSVDKMAATYNRVVSDVKQVYDITRVWPSAPHLGGTTA
ncbi:hypothetical protein CHLRE_05g237750v5 [Chlamydomonas reinhardtii]|uniref:Uncharacterized protein n=1 Tax=Chlamydomonas reinhardtii TaxID=3055 RepID=A0A2K3DSY0_CHLRE|nr:uncharacterized protein CHLRE_05g237750v5 [Chlamydomonas reinhardtii]PNW83637.1 hypothetical protein CHLRE_05g237750v5 [Chlamydomonas reinhardtii]